MDFRRRQIELFALTIFGIAAGVGAGTAAPSAAATASAVPIIPRAVLFGSPDKAAPQISPDGKQLAFLAPVDGVLNIWVAPADDPAAGRAITTDKGSGITQYFWAFDNRHMLYLKDKDGDENHHLYRIDLSSGAITDLTPYDGVKAQVMGVSSRRPNEILVGLNNRDKRLHDIHLIDLTTGKDTLVEENPGYLGYLADENYNVQFALSANPDGSQDVLRRGKDGKYEKFTHIGTEDNFNTGPAGLDADGKILYMMDSRGRNTSVVTATDLASGKETLVAEDPRADAENVFTHPTTGKVRAVSFNYDRRNWKVVDPAIAGDLDFLKKVADGEVQVLSTSLDDQRWVVGYMMDTGPYRFYLYDRPAKAASLLFTNRKALESYTLAKMHSRILKTRDGLDMVAYLTLPVGTDTDGDGVPDKPLPMILMPHGGPWYRDNWGYNGWHQWAANRGYAVLMPEFRGSTGFGKSFLNAANREWGATMHDDLLDAVAWAVKSGIAREDKIAIMGGSYGGYATLWGLTKTPNTFACGVDIFGVSNLVTMLESFPAYWGPAMDMMYQRIGDPRTDEGKKFLLSRSPITYVDQIKKPLLIVHGANDVRVTLPESETLVAKMKERKIPVTFVVYPDEGHLTFFHPQNNISCYAVVEQFLKEHLGGRAEPIGDALKGASIQVREGVDQIPGVREAMADRG
jgi:dipeptidyl aminopeptidase/acylaminoacyl peptidase